MKNIVIADANCRVVFLSATCEGKKHDKTVADEAGYTFPPKSTVYQDKGFQGYDPPKIEIRQPKKKPPKAELTEQEQDENRRISSQRMRIEYVIDSVKRYRIVKDRLRNWRTNFRDQVLETYCGLHNFRLRFRPWSYPDLSSQKSG